MSPDVKDGNQPSKKTPRSIDAVGQFSSFFANDHHAFLVKKAERLASALHIVTGFIAHDEPLRVRLRTLSLDIVRTATDVERLNALGPDAFGTACAEVGALLETAQATGLVSSMNAKLICDEYLSLATFLRDRYSLIRARLQDIHELPPPASPLGFFKGQKDTVPYKSETRTPIQNKGQITDTRRKDILGIFSTKDKISIKDAVVAIPGVSEKTLQRELLSMVADGLLIKEGERRWSTYKKSGTGA